ncbi:hypothetical protein METHB2_280003 [Candidatus Methylobacter favarea]|uniref:Uncharacterized protein n=1 Tax=Candidatus Methylobacter favarea TaxID=2707345 RepID=A0A8S0Y9V9_9GAMM|nr:hypothetical protein METHB2_280003 [Candidatus Methylobacter favarea]
MTFLVLVVFYPAWNLPGWIQISKHSYNFALEQWSYKGHCLAEAIFHVAGKYFLYRPLDGRIVLYAEFVQGTLRSVCLSPFSCVSTDGHYQRSDYRCTLKSNTRNYCHWALDLFGGLNLIGDCLIKQVTIYQ